MLFYTTLLFFVLHVLGVFYSDYPEEGYRFLEKSISYLLVPIIFISFTEAHLLKIRHALLRGLMVGSLVSLISLLGINLYHYFEGQDYLGWIFSIITIPIINLHFLWSNIPHTWEFII